MIDVNIAGSLPYKRWAALLVINALNRNESCTHQHRVRHVCHFELLADMLSLADKSRPVHAKMTNSQPFTSQIQQLQFTHSKSSTLTNITHQQVVIHTGFKVIFLVSMPNVDAGYCHLCLDVMWSVSLLVLVWLSQWWILQKSLNQLIWRLGVQTRVGPSNHAVDGMGA